MNIKNLCFYSSSMFDIEEKFCNCNFIKGLSHFRSVKKLILKLLPLIQYIKNFSSILPQLLYDIKI